jgi:hypothetical protein
MLSDRRRQETVLLLSLAFPDRYRQDELQQPAWGLAGCLWIDPSHEGDEGVQVLAAGKLQLAGGRPRGVDRAID